MGVLKSIVFGTAVGASVLFVLSSIYHIMVKEPTFLLFLLLPLGSFTICFLCLFFFIWFPNHKKIAKRIDETDLHERIGTMLEYQNETTEAALLQRKDALTHLERTSSKLLRLRISKKSLMTCLVCVCLTVCVCLVPYDLFAVEVSAVESDAEHDQMIKELLEELREKAHDDALNDELQAEINDVNRSS